MSILSRLSPVLMLTVSLASALPAAPMPAAPMPVEPMPATDAAPSAAFFDTLRAADLRLATIAYRLTTANAALCDQLQPQVGMPIHALTQYAPGARRAAVATFGFGATIGVEAVVAGGPADRAGVHPNDSIVAIDDRPQPGLPSANAPEAAAARDAAEAAITAAPISKPLRLTVLRDGKRLPIAINPVTGCRSRFEILLGSGLDASADGAIVQLGERFFEGYSDEEIAVVVAHELSHNILRHSARLDAAKINRGLLAELGRNGRLIRETEDQADLLSIYLLANAGYDPMSAANFWRQKGGAIDGGLFRSRTHASSKARAEALEAAAREIAATPTRPIIPPVVAARNVPLR